ncbi:MAG: DUF4258 domain-containing protein [bacterium]
MRVLQRIRRAVRDERYRISTHANEEMSEDELEIDDIEQFILTGRIFRKFTFDPRGTRYQILGRTTGLDLDREYPAHLGHALSNLGPNNRWTSRSCRLPFLRIRHFVDSYGFYS